MILIKPDPGLTIQSLRSEPGSTDVKLQTLVSVMSVGLRGFEPVSSLNSSTNNLKVMPESDCRQLPVTSDRQLPEICSGSPEKGSASLPNATQESSCADRAFPSPSDSKMPSPFRSWAMIPLEPSPPPPTKGQREPWSPVFSLSLQSYKAALLSVAGSPVTLLEREAQTLKSAYPSLLASKKAHPSRVCDALVVATSSKAKKTLQYGSDSER